MIRSPREASAARPPRVHKRIVRCTEGPSQIDWALPFVLVGCVLGSDLPIRSAIGPYGTALYLNVTLKLNPVTLTVIVPCPIGQLAVR